MEQIMGQIEQDILYGDDGTPVPPGTTAKTPPAVLVSPTGVVAKNPQAPTALSTKASLSKSVLDFLTKPAGGVPVYVWGLMGVTVTSGVVALAVALRKPY